MKCCSFRLKQLPFLISGLVLLAIFVAPFFIIVLNAFKTKLQILENTLSLPTSLYFENFAVAFKQLNFLNSLGNSLLITAFSGIVVVVFCSMAAWMLVRTKGFISNFILMAFVAAMLVPFQAVMLPLVSLMGKLGLQNRFGIIIMYLGFGSSLAIFLYHGFIKSIPIALEEAALIDGCSPWTTFWHIIFPTLAPIHITVAILNTMAVWNDFLLPNLMINTPKTQTIPLSMFFFFGGYSKQWHLGMAGLLLAILPVIIFYFVAQKHIVAGMVAGVEK